MLVFLDESFRTHNRTGKPFGVLAGVAIPEDSLGQFHRDIYEVRKPYEGLCLRPHDELKGQKLLSSSALKAKETGFSYKWNLAEEVLQFTRKQGVKVFGVVCFRDGFETFLCADEMSLDLTYRYLFERIDRFMKRKMPGRFAKIIFDDRGHSANKKNGKAITNFFMRSHIGLGYDSIVRTPFFAVSESNNYGLQVADLVTTVIARRFQADRRVDPLWRIVQEMLDKQRVGTQQVSSLKVVREFVK